MAGEESEEVKGVREVKQARANSEQLLHATVVELSGIELEPSCGREHRASPQAKS
jgi:hypothetical protein